MTAIEEIEAYLKDLEDKDEQLTKRKNELTMRWVDREHEAYQVANWAFQLVSIMGQKNGNESTLSIDDTLTIKLSYGSDGSRRDLQVVHGDTSIVTYDGKKILTYDRTKKDEWFSKLEYFYNLKIETEKRKEEIKRKEEAVKELENRLGIQ